MNSATLSPTSPKVKRKQSTRRPRAISHPHQTQETHDAALYSIRAFLRSRTSYDAFPVSFRLIVLDSQLEVRKALQCLLLNGEPPPILRHSRRDPGFSVGVVSAPLWNSEKSVFAGMFTVSDIIHLIQYYYRTSSYDNATSDVETFRLESIRGAHPRLALYSRLITLLLRYREKSQCGHTTSDPRTSQCFPLRCCTTPYSDSRSPSPAA